MRQEYIDEREPLPEGGIPNYQIGDLIEVDIMKIVPRGFGLAFADGLTVFVALAVAGDRVVVRLTEIKGKTAFAEIERVVSPAADRITPPCIYVGTCGGCDFQQMTYEAQLAAKVGIIRDNLKRIGKIDYEREIRVIPSPREFAYRLRAQWHIDGARREIGYYQRNSRELVAVEHCPILVPELDDELQRVRGTIDWASFSQERGAIDVACGDEGAISTFSNEIDPGSDEINLTVAGETYTFTAEAFFQGNRYLVGPLVEIAIGDASGDSALDLYSGVGLFTLPLARRFRQVTAVEDSPLAVGFARRNISNAGLSNVEIIDRSVGRYLADMRADEIDFALLDPPRFGTEKKTVLDLIRLRPKIVSYVSCDPSVLARDLRRFLDGGYSVESISALDLFPQTHHVETVVRLQVDEVMG